MSHFGFRGSINLASSLSSTHLCVSVQESREQALESEIASVRWAALRAALEEADRVVQDSLAQLDELAHISCTSSAG